MMIKTKQDLADYIAADNCGYSLKNRDSLYLRFVKEEFYWIDRFLLFLRKQEYYTNNIPGHKLNILLAAHYARRKNAVGRKVGLNIAPNCVGKGVTIHHANVVVNSGAHVGEYCSFHGNNCIGNDGVDQAVPEIGDHVDIGYAATIIGGIKLADDIRIGAGAVVTKDCTESGSVLVGVPAHPVKKPD